MSSNLLEQRVRQFAAALMRVVEVYYKPLLSHVWKLSARMANFAGVMPRTCGQIMHGCQSLWGQLSDIVVPQDFLDWKALEIRNGIAHPAKTHFDLETNELVFRTDSGQENRFSETEIKGRLGAVLCRCLVMHDAFVWVMGDYPSGLLGKGERPSEKDDSELADE